MDLILLFLADWPWTSCTYAYFIFKSFWCARRGSRNKWGSGGRS